LGFGVDGEGGGGHFWEFLGLICCGNDMMRVAEGLVLLLP
jgi:hypothetical protein